MGLDWCFIDELEPVDVVRAGAAAVAVTGVDLVRVPSGGCEWRVHTTGPILCFQVLDRAPRIAA